MDRLSFIAEVRIRPVIWDYRTEEYQTRKGLPEAWQEIATNMKATVDECKKLWKLLRDNYFGEMKRLENRIEKDVRSGNYSLSNDYSTKWKYHNAMKFYTYRPKVLPMPKKADAIHGSLSDWKDNDMEFDLNQDNSIQEDSETTSDESDYQEEEEDPEVTPLKLSNKRPRLDHEDEEANTAKKSKLSEEQHNSTSSNLVDVGDADYNFLVSCLPEMKKMSALHNLEFRAKMSDIICEILSKEATTATDA